MMSRKQVSTADRDRPPMRNRSSHSHSSNNKSSSRRERRGREDNGYSEKKGRGSVEQRSANRDRHDKSDGKRMPRKQSTTRKPLRQSKTCSSSSSKSTQSKTKSKRENHGRNAQSSKEKPPDRSTHADVRAGRATNEGKRQSQLKQSRSKEKDERRNSRNTGDISRKRGTSTSNSRQPPKKKPRKQLNPFIRLG